MARGRRPPGKAELPPPLPPESRTVGQLVGEAIRLYGARFFAALPLGLVFAGADQLMFDLDREHRTLAFVLLSPVFTLAYAYAVRLATGARPGARGWAVALVAGTLVFLPAALTFLWFALASVLWLALAGLTVPAAMVEGTSLAGSIRRGVALGRAGYVHAAGSLATLVLLFGITRLALTQLLTSQAENAVRTAVFLSDTVLAPLIFLGSALLYVDQEARLRSRGERGKERDADLPDADAIDGEGRAHAAREPGPPP